MDAQRVLKKLGFSSQIVLQAPAGPSDEDHNALGAGFSNNTCESMVIPQLSTSPLWLRQIGAPDYRDYAGEQQLLFEVKEFNFSKEDSREISSPSRMDSESAAVPMILTCVFARKLMTLENNSQG